MKDLLKRFDNYTASEMLSFYERYVCILSHNTTAEMLWNIYEEKLEDIKFKEYIEIKESEKEERINRIYDQN